MIIDPAQLSPTLIGRTITIQHDGTTITGRLTKLALNVSIGSTPGQSVKARLWNDSRLTIGTTVVYLGPHDTIQIEDE